jgi:hypothetical protein
MRKRLGENAVVIGGSIAGLMTEYSGRFGPRRPSRAKTRNPSLLLVPRTDVSVDGTRLLRVNLRKAGRFFVKCLGDLARDVMMIGFWP